MCIRDRYHKTLGLIGFGNIAKNVARRAHGFSMDVIAYDPYVKEIPEEFKEYVRLGTLDEVIENGDFCLLYTSLFWSFHR